MKKIYTVKEYDVFTCDIESSDIRCTSLKKKTFEKLEKFILTNNEVKNSDMLDFMTVTIKKGIGKVITVKNYVGLVSTNDGSEIEILPKIYSKEHNNDKQVKDKFLEMIKTLSDIPHKKFHISNTDASKMNIMEIFIKMFIEEVFILVKRGLKAAYSTYDGQHNFYKGKLIFSEHLKRNIVHKEKIYIEYDIFDTNRAENRLIKTTLKLLFGKTKNSENKRDLAMLIKTFDDIDYSSDYKQEFKQYVKNRNIIEYDTIMQWCRIFLEEKCFTSFSGNEYANALLFPMEKVFESYVAAKLRQEIDKNIYTIKTQDSKKYLFELPYRKFALKPDITITDKLTNKVTIIDTKWKILDLHKQNYGISQIDMYQMYAYHKKHSANQVILLYPMNESISHLEKEIYYESKDGERVTVLFVDLFDMKNSIENILEKIYDGML